MRVNKKKWKIKFQISSQKEKMGVAPAGNSVRSRAFQCSVAYVPLHSKAGFRQAQPPLLNGCAALPIANAKNATPKIRRYSSPRRKSTANISELNPTATGEYMLPSFVSFTCAMTEVR